MKVKLLAPPEYKKMLETDPDLLNSVTGGCGPGGAGDKLVPDRIIGVRVTKACKIHDFEYSAYMPGTFKQKADADIRLEINSVRIIEAKSRIKTLKRLRKFLAKIYYWAVKYGGHDAFWADKDMPNTVEVEIDI